MMAKKEVRILFRMLLIISSIVLLLILAIGITKYFRYSGNKQTEKKIKSFGIHLPSGFPIHGIDVSRHQGKIDWKRVATMKSKNTVITFAFVKATEGITRQDNKFKYNWEQTKNNNILRGAYHFYYPSRDAEKQAENFISQVKLSKGDLPPVVDIELSNGKSTAEIQKGLQMILDKLEEHYNVKPIIYTGINFYNNHLIGKFDDYPLWIAGYFDHDRFYNEFGTPWIFWQHSEKGKVDGIRGNVDFNVFNGSQAKLAKLCLKK